VESVAAHSWGVAFLALLRCPPQLDRHRVLTMALLHDLAEVRVGDLTPHDGVPPDVKHSRERAAMQAMLGHRPDLLDLWEEAEACVTPEARFVKLLDRVDMGLQAERYMDAGHEVSEFLAATRAARDALFGSASATEETRPAVDDEPARRD
jgi:putative hydrolase of HD superfamily